MDFIEKVMHSINAFISSLPCTAIKARYDGQDAIAYLQSNEELIASYLQEEADFDSLHQWLLHRAANDFETSLKETLPAVMLSSMKATACNWFLCEFEAEIKDILSADEKLAEE